MAKFIPNDGTFTGKSLVGKRFRRWIVTGFAGWHQYKDGRKESAWECKCSCGNTGVIGGSNLRCGDSKSCGCWNQRMIGLSNLRHGLSSHKLYNVHQCMKARCYNKNNKRYHRYGGRGIKICKRWLSFIYFARDMFPTWKEGLTLERIDNDGNYTPKNCTWATHKRQCNNRSTCHWIRCHGKKMSATDWANEPHAVGSELIIRRIAAGWKNEEAIFLPLKGSLAWWALGIRPRGRRSAKEIAANRPASRITRFARKK